MDKADLIKALEELPEDTILLAQVVAPDGSAWNMEYKLTGVLEHFKWDHPVAVLSLFHPGLKSLNPLVWHDPTQQEER